MKNTLALILALAGTPFAALAAPEVGDEVGTNADDAKLALKELGCLVQTFEAEDGKIEARCIDAKGQITEVYIDPASGQIADIKGDEEG